jgi:hypothetical protein
MSYKSLLFNKLWASLVVFSFVFAALPVQASIPGKSLSEDQRIAHVLNRLGFGARPGDVERVKKIGLQKYIDQQLNPTLIDDAVAESKLKGLEVFGMTTAQIFAKYPNPGAGHNARPRSRAADDRGRTTRTPSKATGTLSRV